MYRYYTNGVCAKSILLDIEDDVVLDVAFEGGCEGALIAIKNLVRGQNIDYIHVQTNWLMHLKYIRSLYTIKIYMKEMMDIR